MNNVEWGEGYGFVTSGQMNVVDKIESHLEDEMPITLTSLFNASPITISP